MTEERAEYGGKPPPDTDNTKGGAGSLRGNVVVGLLGLAVLATSLALIVGEVAYNQRRLNAAYQVHYPRMLAECRETRIEAECVDMVRTAAKSAAWHEVHGR